MRELIWRCVTLIPILCGGAALAAAPPSRVTPQILQEIPPAVRAAGEIRVGSQETFAPMEYRADGSPQVIGASADLLTEIGRRLGLRIVYVHAEYASLISGLQARRFDLASGGISDTEAREGALDFVNYFSSGVSILLRSNEPARIETVDDLCRRTVAVLQGSQVIINAVNAASARCRARSLEGIAITPYPATPDVRMQLHLGRVDAYLADYPALVFLSNRFPGEYRIAGGRYMLTTYILSWGFRKDNPGLRNAVQAAAQDMLQDGTYRAILNKWHVGDAALPAITLNLPASRRR